MKFLLTSSSVNNKGIVNELERLAGKVLAECNLAFIITASLDAGDDKSWLINNLVDFQSLNLKRLDILDVVVPDSKW